MRITVAHAKTKDEIKRIVDRSFDDVFRGAGPLPVALVNEKRTWKGDTLFFSFDAKVSLLSSPVKGTIDVTEREVTIDADFGLLEKLLPSAKSQAIIETRIKGLLS